MIFPEKLAVWTGQQSFENFLLKTSLVNQFHESATLFTSEILSNFQYNIVTLLKDRICIMFTLAKQFVSILKV